MKLLPFRMPPSARTVWVSKESKEVWAPKIQRAAHAYYRMERLTVAEGLRACTTFHASPDRMEVELLELAKDGLVFLPIQKVGQYSGFAHSHPPVVTGKPWNFYGVVGRDAAALYAFVDATKRGDHPAMGKLLGYPDCCCEFFNTVWRAGYVDPIWQQAEACAVVRGEQQIEVYSSVLWDGYRYIGVRVVPHLPCSMDCKPSLSMAESWLALARARGVEGIDDLIDCMALPCEWDCLKGVAQITTPHFRIVTNSVACYPGHRVLKAAGLAIV